MVNLGLTLKIGVPKKSRKVSNSNVTIIASGKKGKVFIDDNGVYKVNILREDLPEGYKSTALVFTDKSYNLKGVKSVFIRNTDRTKQNIRIIRSERDAKAFPGDSKKYIPFAPNWIVKGKLVKENSILKFDFVELVTIDGYVNTEYNE